MAGGPTVPSACFSATTGDAWVLRSAKYPATPRSPTRPSAKSRDFSIAKISFPPSNSSIVTRTLGTLIVPKLEEDGHFRHHPHPWRTLVMVLLFGYCWLGRFKRHVGWESKKTGIDVPVHFEAAGFFGGVLDCGCVLEVRFRAKCYPVPHPPFLQVFSWGNRIDFAGPPQKLLLTHHSHWHAEVFNGRIFPDPVVISLAHVYDVTCALAFFFSHDVEVGAIEDPRQRFHRGELAQDGHISTVVFAAAAAAYIDIRDS